MGKKGTTVESVENLTILIDWTSSIYGIFWGIWLGIFLQKIWENLSNPEAIAKLPSFIPTSYLPYLLPGLALLICLYTYNFVKWLWMMRYITKKSTSSHRITFEKYPIFLSLILLVAIIFSGIAFGISSIQVGLVLGASVFWPITVIMIVNWDWRGWLYS